MAKQTDYTLRFLTSSDLKGAEEMRRALADVGEALPTDKLDAFEKETSEVFAKLRERMEGAKSKVDDVGEALETAGDKGGKGADGIGKLGDAMDIAKGGVDGLAGNLPNIIELIGGGAGLAGAAGLAVVAIGALVEWLSKVEGPSFEEWAVEAQKSSAAINAAYAGQLKSTLDAHAESVRAVVKEWRNATTAAHDYLAQANSAMDAQRELEAAKAAAADEEALAMGVDPSVIAAEKAARTQADKRAAEMEALQRAQNAAAVDEATGRQGVAAADAKIAEADKRAAEAEFERKVARGKLRQAGVPSDQERMINENGGLEEEKASLQSRIEQLKKGPMDQGGAIMLGQAEERLAAVTQKLDLVADALATARAQFAAGQETYTNTDGLTSDQDVARGSQLAAMSAADMQAKAAEATKASAAQDRATAAKQLADAQAALRNIDTRRQAAETRNLTEDRAQSRAEMQRLEAEDARRKKAEYDSIYGGASSKGAGPETAAAAERAAASVAGSADQVASGILGSMNEMQSAMAKMASAVERSVESSSAALRAAERAERAVAELRRNGQTR